MKAVFVKLQQKLLKKTRPIVFERIEFTPFDDSKTARWYQFCANFSLSDENVLLDKEISDWGLCPANTMLPEFYTLEDVNRGYFATLLLNIDKNSWPNKKTRFCVFCQHNAGPKARIRFYEALSAYKRVDATSTVLRNTPSNSKRFVGNWIKEAVDQYLPYKFSVSFENSVGRYYHTEKIQLAFAANTVPIYWGCPNITQYYNPEAFINAYDFDSLESLANYVAKVDQDDALYARYRAAPIFASGQFAKYKKIPNMEDRIEVLYTNSEEAVIHLPKAQANNFLREVISCSSRKHIDAMLRRRMKYSWSIGRFAWPRH